MTLSEKQDQMIAEINELGDCFDQYAYLLVKAAELPSMGDSRKTDAALVSGCQSQVWLYYTSSDGRIHFEADSDTLILRGVLQLLHELLDGESAADAAALDICLFRATALGATFTSDRNTGVRTIIRRICGTN